MYPIIRSRGISQLMGVKGRMVREGYKETELGEIPEEWNYVSFQDI